MHHNCHTWGSYWATAALLLFLAYQVAGCAGMPRSLDEDQVDQSIAQSTALKRAIAAYDSGSTAKSKSEFELLAESADADIRDTAELYLGRIQAESDPGLAVDRLRRLVKNTESARVRHEARYFAGLHAVKAKRCMTAQKMLEPLLKQTLKKARQVQVFRAYLSCLPAQKRVDWLSEGMAKNLPDSLYVSLLSELTAEQLAELISNRQLTTSLRTSAAEALSDRRSEVVDAETLTTAARLLPDASEARQALEQKLVEAPVTVILPLSGRGRRLGQEVQGQFNDWAAHFSEDRVGGAPFKIVDGGEPELVEDVFRAAARRGEDALIGLFDRRLSKTAVRAAEEFNMPALMLTRSRTLDRSSAPVWKLLPSELLVARTVAGLAISRGHRRLLIIRDAGSYGKNYGRWMAEVWKASGRTVVAELTLPKGGHEMVAGQIHPLQFDAIFMPMPAEMGAELLQYLATKDIWVRGRKARFAKSENMREVSFFVTPEWYGPNRNRLLRRYGEGVLVPVSFAAETARGSQLKRIARSDEPSVPFGRLFALALDAIRAVQEARKERLRNGSSFIDQLREVKLTTGLSVGFDFDSKNAVQSLMIVQWTSSGFRPID